MSFYLVRVGSGGRYVEEAHRSGFIAVGWNEISDLKKLGDIAHIKSSLLLAYPNYTTPQIAAQAGQLSRFGLDMQLGDIVLSPLGEGRYLYGKVGEYFYETNPFGVCPFQHRRHIDWDSRILKKDEMSSNLAYALGATLTVFSLDKYAQEIESLIEGKLMTPAEKPLRIRDGIIASLLELDGKEFEDFISHLFEILGFESHATQYVGDKGIDVIGILNAEGLADITLHVQVKRVRSSIGNKEVLAIRGTLNPGEHACLITLSTFTAQAEEEASALKKDQVKLIDGEDLASLILNHFDELDVQYRQLFGITRKRDLNLEDQFEILNSGLTTPLQLQETKQPKRDWDTIVCAAKEDGFKEAFLNQ